SQQKVNNLWTDRPLLLTFHILKLVPPLETISNRIRSRLPVPIAAKESDTFILLSQLVEAWATSASQYLHSKLFCEDFNVEENLLRKHTRLRTQFLLLSCRIDCRRISDYPLYNEKLLKFFADWISKSVNPVKTKEVKCNMFNITTVRESKELQQSNKINNLNTNRSFSHCSQVRELTAHAGTDRHVPML
ncbi:Hypothetical predicted protein, partial [Paramuricea clavata]